MQNDIQAVAKVRSVPFYLDAIVPRGLSFACFLARALGIRYEGCFSIPKQANIVVLCPLSEGSDLSKTPVSSMELFHAG